MTSARAGRKSGYPRLIGVIHLPPLGDAPGGRGRSASELLDHAGSWAVSEAKLLARMGFDGLILENFGDAPFFADSVPPETISSLSLIAAGVMQAAPNLEIGLNVLRNDGRAALGIASTLGLSFIRINVLSGVAAGDQGWLIGRAADLARTRARLGADSGKPLVFADAHVKHAQTLHSDRIEQAVEDLSNRGLADAVIVSGAATGKHADLDQLKRAASAASKSGVPLYLGSGADSTTIAHYAPWLSGGVIVSSALRQGGKAGAPLELKRVKGFVAAWKAAQKGPRKR